MKEQQAQALVQETGGVTAVVADARPGKLDIRAELASARQLLGEDRSSEAEQACRNVLEVDPHQSGALLLLYRVLLRQDRIDEASTLYAQGDWVSQLTPKARQVLALSFSVAERRQLAKRMQDALTLRDLKSAREAYASAESELRKDLAIRLLHARLLLAEGDAEAAERECRSLQECDNSHPSHLLVLCKAIARQGRGAEARELFIQAIWPGPFTPEQKGALLRKVTNRCTADELRALTERLEALRPTTVTEQTRLAVAELRIGQPEAAARRLEAIESSTGRLSELQADQLIKALIDADRLEDARKRLQILMAQAPEHPVWAVLMARLLMRGSDTEASSRLVVENLKLFPRSPQFVEFLSTLPLAPEPFAQIASQVLEDWRSIPVVPARTALALARAALHARDTRAAAQVLERADRGVYHLDTRPKDLHRLLSLYPVDFWTGQARFRDDLREAIQVIKVPNARVTAVAFPALGNAFGSLPFDYLDALLSRHAVNVIYLRDHYGRAFLDPGPELGGSRDGLVELLNHWKTELGGVPLMTLGSSAGGFAAARYGVWADVRSVISFAGPTKLFSSDDRPSDSCQSIGLAYLRNIPEEVRDVVPGLAARRHLRFWHVIGALNNNDQFQQAGIRELDNVVAVSLPEVAAHNTFIPAVSGGVFDSLLAEAINEACGCALPRRT